MKNCPFWSTNNKKFNCYKECPMNTFFSINDNCPFQEYLANTKISFKGIEEIAYKQSKDDDIKVDFLSSYSGK
ncbi:MAG: hypothetical protein PUE01_09045 [Clostridiaceae bacterium]|nr:hypothetical protein [Clostridiaceae bacterium]